MSDSLSFTTSQQQALAAFKSFLQSDEQVFMLKGAAGTGKTTLVNAFIRLLEANRRECRLMAPTGRAAYILSRKTRHKATTIHSGIYSLASLHSASQDTKSEEDDGIHLTYNLKANTDSRNTVYFVDESSMVSDAFSHAEAFSFGSGCLLTDLFSFAQGRKIVFVGDDAQLPPVSMNFSPALDKEYIENKYGCQVIECMLSDVMRQAAGSVMLANVTKIRDSIYNKTFIEFKLDKGDDSEADDTDLLRPFFEVSPDKPGVRSAIITYSNSQALNYNLAVRRHYYGSDAPRLKPGDLLIISRNNYYYDYELFNGNIVKVESCQPDNEIVRRKVNVKIGKDRTECVELSFRKATIAFTDNGKPVSLNVTLLDNFTDSPAGSVGGLLAQALIVDFDNRLPDNLKAHIKEIRRLLKSKKSLTDEEQQLRDAYIRLLNSDPYYNAVICKYGYAMTCHKAQGGEWDYVFVDMCRFGGTANEDYFRWAYTALTRASKKIWHFRSPEFNYISNLVVEEITPSAKIKVSNYAGETDFCTARFERIRQRALENGLEVSEDRSKSYQHIITFTDNKSGKATFQLWYNAKGYTNGNILMHSTSEELSALCSTLIDYTYAPGIVPFSAPDRPFAEKLVSFVKSQLEETGIQLLDITQESYQDVFHLKTDGLAQIGFIYTARGNYTHMRLISSLGQNDQKLQELRKRFI